MSDITAWMNKFRINCSEDRLREALTHPSLRVVDENIRDYEQLETIGDAVLDLLILEYILKRFPNATPSQLTKGRSNIVSNKVLGELGRKIKIDKILMRHAHYDIVDNDLSNSIEAILGAIYIENGMDACNSFLDEIITPLLDIVNRLYGGIDINSVKSNPVGQLQEMMQRRRSALPVYEVIERKGPDNDPTYRIKVSVDLEGTVYSEVGDGNSKQRSKEKAADKLLEILRENNTEIV